MDTPVECARHPGRVALTRCARCERPVCGEDIIEAPVGYQCVDCARSGPPVRHALERPPTPRATRLIVMMIVGVALLGMTGSVEPRTFGLVPVLVGLGDWWRPITSALLHAGFLHLAFNGILLWRLGEMLEPVVGPGAFLGLAASGMAGGSLGVIGLAWLSVASPIGRSSTAMWVLGASPTSITVGASGAVFGLMGAVLILLRRQGVDPRTTSEGSMVLGLVMLNLVLTFAIPSISVGGHVGGLLAGSGAAFLVGGPTDPRRRDRRSVRAHDATVTLLVASVLLIAAIALARALVRAIIG